MENFIEVVAVPTMATAKAKTMTAIMGENREAFASAVQMLSVEGFEYVGRTEKGFLFSNENDNFVTVGVTAHKGETPTTLGFDGVSMLEQYSEKQAEKAKKKEDADNLKAKKIAAKEKAKLEKE